MTIDALVFDLGGVLIRLDWDAVFAHWARCSGADPAVLRERFAFDEAYARHERGEIDAARYFEAVRRALAIDLPDAELEAGWNALFVGEIAETTRLVAQAAERVPVHLFSNTNTAHQAAWSRDYAVALRPFARRFVSSEIGLRKPDRAAFEHVAREIGVPPGRILFFDDTEANVAGARAAGFQAVHVGSPEDVAGALDRLLG
ncbi:MAG TPA: HAD family phosphatase [Usitatibacter sp.]|jgi:putative hydrolase of the HAD superfamily|nr:HAD family phosphatase [Usitatibacter sp.]